MNIIKTSGQFEKKNIPKYIILPNGTWKSRWDLLIILFVIYNIVITPLDIGFSLSNELPKNWKYLENSIDACFFIDIALSFFTALVDEFGHVNANLKDIGLKNFR